MESVRTWREHTKHWTGIDRAVLYTVASRLFQVLGSTVTVLLIIRFLSPIEQGYYYTLLSLAALQTIFELGFSFVILQLAAHESALLIFGQDGAIEGDSVAHARLASVLQLTVRWYFRAAVALILVVAPAGIAFFSERSGGAAQVAWLGPWLAAVLALSGTFFLTPICAYLEGCNQVLQVARLRMAQAAIVVAVSWAAIASGAGLYACALVNVVWIAAALVFLGRRRRLLLGLMRHRAGSHAVSWRREIWPFQWQIAVSWFCSYFTLQLFTPILFAFRGPQEAGRMGLSLSITGYLPIFALGWVTTKAAPFGVLIKLGRVGELDAIFLRTMKQGLAFVAILAMGLWEGVRTAESHFPSLAARVEPASILALLLLAGISSFVVQSLAVYLRSYKKEPYLAQSLGISGLTLAAIFLAVPRWGSAAVAAIYFLTSGVIGLLWAIAIFHRASRRRKDGRTRQPGADVMPAGIMPIAGAVAGMEAP